MEDRNLDGQTRGFGGRVRNTIRVELNFWRDCLLNAAGLILAWVSLPAGQIEFNNIFSFAALVVAIWFMNWIIRPILVLFTLPFIIFTMGVGMLFINALIIYWAARLIPGEGIGVSSYWAALWASFIVSVLTWAIAMARSEKIIRRALKKDSEKSKDDDVIDI
ncbi:MAG: hypothetical protein BHW65_08675 [Verrucomicrobia bacterium CAG:312_58_20]|nr:MAG: hypothetical protein BHW65_08675 [Verrucomicrobia bacterium CAG:312_58_20]PWL68296.1 MAG: hypothetical protein DBY30_02795 [Verrucomicrobiota bacterium]